MSDTTILVLAELANAVNRAFDPVIFAVTDNEPVTTIPFVTVTEFNKAEEPDTTTFFQFGILVIILVNRG